METNKPFKSPFGTQAPVKKSEAVLKKEAEKEKVYIHGDPLPQNLHFHRNFLSATTEKPNAPAKPATLTSEVAGISLSDLDKTFDEVKRFLAKSKEDAEAEHQKFLVKDAELEAKRNSEYEARLKKRNEDHEKLWGKK